MSLAFLDYTPILDLAPGPLVVSPHGVGTAVGVIAGACLLLPATRRRGIDDAVVYQLLTPAIAAALIGARLAYVLNHLSDYADRPLEALRVWEGGASLLGGIVAAVVIAARGMRRAGLDFWSVMDAAAPGLALGVAIGRVGDLIVADHLGKPTDFVLATAAPAPTPPRPAVRPSAKQSTNRPSTTSRRYLHCWASCSGFADARCERGRCSWSSSPGTAPAASSKTSSVSTRPMASACQRANGSLPPT